MKQLFSREEVLNIILNWDFDSKNNNLKAFSIREWFNKLFPEDNTISDEQAALNADMDLYPGNEAGAFDYLDHQSSDDTYNELLSEQDEDSPI